MIDKLLFTLVVLATIKGIFSITNLVIEIGYKGNYWLIFGVLIFPVIIGLYWIGDIFFKHNQIKQTQ